LRDRGYVYWRLLSADPEAAKQVVLGEKPVIVDNSSKIDESLLKNLITNIGYVCVFVFVLCFRSFVCLYLFICLCIYYFAVF
jgi:hypothetical protein